MVGDAWLRAAPFVSLGLTHLHHVVDRVEAARARVVREQPQQAAKGLVAPQVVGVPGPPPVGPERVPEQALRHDHLGGALCVCFLVWVEGVGGGVLGGG